MTRSCAYAISHIVVVSLLLCAPLSAQGLGGLIQRATGGGNTPPAPNPAAAAAAASADADLNEGTIEGYLEMRAFAEGLYHQLEGAGDSQRTSEFKRRVDKAFENANKDDMQRAFEMNISAKSEVRYVIEDKFRVYSGLYENPVVQELTNRVGQSVVSAKVTRLYTFKLVADPVPWAESLSTGTVWVSTGMVALMKNKAQLAYVLAHEAAHVYLDHHRQRLLLQYGQEEYNRQLAENGENRRKRWIWVNAAVGAVSGGVVSKLAGDNPEVGALLGGAAGAVVGNLIAGATNPHLLGGIEWNRFEEDEADRLAMDWLLDVEMDVTEIPNVYLALRDIGDRDPRAKLGFLGRTDRVRERVAAVQARLDFERRQPGWPDRKFASSDPDFALLLAQVQRDNGVFAFHYDMLETARENLQGAAAVLTKDPTALYFYARVLSQTARSAAEREQADDYFHKAAENDYRNQNYGAYLHRAIQKLTNPQATTADKSQAVEFLKQYVIGYHLSGADEAKAKTFNLPPHLEIVYDYLARAGDLIWRFDDATLKRVEEMSKTGVPLVEYKDPTTPRQRAVQQIQSSSPSPQPQRPTPKPAPPASPAAKPAARQPAN